MKVTRLEEAVKYNPPKHFNCCAMYLQHKNLGSDAPYWVGCSHYLPGGEADWDAGPLPKIYVVLEGELTMAFKGKEFKLGPLDSIYIAPGESRQVRNDRNRVATMLVVMPYPPAQT